MRSRSTKTAIQLQMVMSRVAESTSMSDDWDVIVRRLDPELVNEISDPAGASFRSGSVPDPIALPEGQELGVIQLPTQGGKAGWIVGTAAAVLGLVAVTQSWSGEEVETVTIAPDEVNLVLPGEVVLSEDPLIVSAAIGPEVHFDTSGLGQEVVFEPITDLDDEISELLDRRWGPGPEEASLTKGTLIGRVNGLPIVTSIFDGPDSQSDDSTYPAGSNPRFRALSWPGGGGTSGKLVALPSLELVVNEAGTTDARLDTPGNMVVWSYLPAETAVVSLAGPFYQAWMRPKGGVVAFPTRFDNSEPVILVAFDADGDELGRISDVVSRPSVVVPNPARAGDMVGVLLGSDGDGDPLRIEANGKMKIFVVGADWCRACNDDLAKIVETLSRPGLEAELFVVPSPLTDGQWPVADPPPFPRFVPNSTSTFWNIGAGIPMVIVLDGDNRLVTVLEGFEDVSLTTLGLGHN